MSYFYRGRHRAPVERGTGRTLAVGAAAAALTLPGLAVTAPEARADILDEIERCESGGRNVPNASGASTASGYFQFLDGTWRGLGYSGRAMDHSYATQRAAAEKLLAQSGTSPWNASSDCWRGSGGGVENRSARSVSTPKATTRARPAPKAASVSGRRAADGTGSAVCTRDKLHFEACDPANLGERFQYPRYDGHGKHSSGVVKAAHKAGKHRAAAPADLNRRDNTGRGTFTCDVAHLGYDSCDPHLLGQRVAYPRFD